MGPRARALIACWCGAAAAACSHDYEAIALVAQDGGVDASGATGGVGGEGGGGTGGTAGGGAGGQGGAGGEGNAAGAGPCAPGTVGDVVDDFEDGAFEPLWQPYGGMPGDVAVNGGRAEIVPSSSATSVRGFFTPVKYALADCAVHAEIVEVPERGDPVILYFEVWADSDHWAQFTFYDGYIGYKVMDAVPLSEGDVLFQPAVHRFVRFREAGGTLHVESSPNAIAWNEAAALATPAFAAVVEVGAGAVTLDNGPQPSTVAIDNVNVLP